MIFMENKQTIFDITSKCKNPQTIWVLIGVPLDWEQSEETTYP